MRAFLLAAAMSAFSIPLLAAGAHASTCYETETRQDGVTCSGNSSPNSADFTAQCVPRYVTVQVPVPCPARWVNTADANLTQQAVCGAQGMQAASMPNGAICASGETRPLSGTGWNQISYRYGTWGNAGHVGMQITRGVIWTGGGGGWSGAGEGAGHVGGGESVPGPHYCWEPGQKRDNDATDIVVAWVCQ